ncbi:class I SAM-dependent methyltransferase [Phorcysia thermohydrogeniphila]|uniref:Methyltransferase family protein n=1 Tax=Phorcysia thermohydrogeniphila TaxID=936138 RepID=A0A4R1GE47_9BACT|nr:class I SAM-dependent methyltransferase [Phorcysia thermohydrogeniphila]TCK06677.1 methyltransferase family protein [Phorcysia thermohydrogeniphila]
MESNAFCGKVAEEYDSFFETEFGKKVFSFERELLLKVLEDKRDKEILEVGCGTGIWIKTLVEEGFKEPIGIDISEDMLRVARRKGLKKLVRGDAHHLPFKKNSVDVVLFITSLEFIGDGRKAFVEAVKVAKEAVVVGFLNKYSLLSAYRYFKSLLKATAYRKANFLSLDEIKSFARFAREITDKIVTFDTFYTTLNLCVDGFLSDRIERKLGFNLPIGGFGVVRFRVKERDGAGKRGYSRRGLK